MLSPKANGRATIVLGAKSPKGPSPLAAVPPPDEWDDERRKRCKASHALFDADGSGSISYKELIPALERYGVTLPKGTEAIDYILAYDSNPDGKLDYTEFE